MNKVDEYEDRSALAGDGCLGIGNQRFLCGVAAEQTVFWLPWLGWAGAIASSLVTARAAARRDGSPWLGILIGALIYAVATVAAYSIAAS